MENIVQHYATWVKHHKPARLRSRELTLINAGFRPAPSVILPWEHGSPIRHARERAERLVKSEDFQFKAVHFVLLDCKNMDGATGYQIYRKFLD